MYTRERIRGFWILHRDELKKKHSEPAGEEEKIGQKDLTDHSHHIHQSHGVMLFNLF